MILTGSEIAREHARGAIRISPFRPDQVNPNSYNFRLGRRLTCYTADVLDPERENEHDFIDIPDAGYVLEPHRLYLAHTEEILGSTQYAPTFAARSSVARLGLFINLSACLGDIGFVGQWTLQLYPLNRIKVYPGMCIGQMMWWKPVGEIELYSGKYQGSHGPRASDIHVDFRRQLARRRLPGLGSGVDSSEVGGKFAALSAMSAQFPVPPAFSVGVEEFATALGPDRYAVLRRAFDEIRDTVGVFVDDNCRTIADAVAEVSVPPVLRELIGERLVDIDLGGGFGVAVRSSAVGEDGRWSSLAGVYRSVLGVDGLDDVVKAIECCWQSYYSPTAVLGRVRAGDVAPDPRMAVVVQRMVPAAQAGVAFSRSATTVDVEYVCGTGDALVAGVADPDRATVVVDTTGGPRHDDEAVPLVESVARLVLRARAALGHEVDVEWASDPDGALWLLQCRPVTAPHPMDLYRDEPVVRVGELHPSPGAAPDELHLGAVARIVASYRAKRGPAFAIAAGCGARTLPGWVVNVNGRGLVSPGADAALTPVLNGPADQCVVDFSDGVRQQILDRRELLDRLRAVFLCGAADTLVHALVVRSFLPGELGVLSGRSDADLVVETSAEGLLAMNRGNAATRRCRSGEPGGPLSAAQLATIARVTAALERRYGRVTAEWVVHRGELYFVDYSVVGQAATAVTVDHTVVSPGTASGPVVRLDMSEDRLERLSLGAAVNVSTSGVQGRHAWITALRREVCASPVPPIVVARRPYAALSVLIGHVAGFVFEGGAVLCHLSILLREAGVPAVICPEPPTSGTVRIGEDGRVTS